jgi:small-conductance mechanosensitive channel
MRTIFRIAQKFFVTDLDGNLWKQYTQKIWNIVRNTDMWTAASLVAMRLLLIVVISRVGLWLLDRIIDHVTSERETNRLKLRSRRVQTVGKLMKNTATYAVNFIVLLLILGEFHINLGPLIAGAGVIGLAVGFGAQSLVKDVITGFFIILEDQFAVGDVVQAGAFRGTVEMIGLRATRLRSWTGELHIIPNGSINEITNYSIYNALAVIDITVSYEDKLDQAMMVIRNVLTKFEDPNLTGTPELLGIQTMGPADVTLRITAECRPNTQNAIVRRLQTEVKKTFEVEGIKSPLPRMVTVQRAGGT